MTTGAPLAAVHQDGEIIFLLDVHALGDEHLVDEPPLRPGLVGDEHLPEHLAGDLLGFLGVLDEMHAALEPVLERPLAPAAGVDLRLDDEFAADLAGDGGGFLRRVGDLARRRGDAVFLEEFLGLVFVDVHVRGDRKGNGKPAKKQRGTKAATDAEAPRPGTNERKNQSMDPRAAWQVTIRKTNGCLRCRR